MTVGGWRGATHQWSMQEKNYPPEYPLALADGSLGLRLGTPW